MRSFLAVQPVDCLFDSLKCTRVSRGSFRRKVLWLHSTIFASEVLVAGSSADFRLSASVDVLGDAFGWECFTIWLFSGSYVFLQPPHLRIVPNTSIPCALRQSNPLACCKWVDTLAGLNNKRLARCTLHFNRCCSCVYYAYTIV